MSATVFQLLEALPAHFAGVAPSKAAARQACKASGELARLASTFDSGTSGDQSRLEQLLIAVAQSLADRAQVASRAFSTGTAPSWLAVQVAAGCNAIFGCSVLAAHTPELSAAAAFKVAAACSLLFGPGAGLLQLQLRGAMSGTAAAAALLYNHCSAQLMTVACVLGKLLRPPQQPRVAAAFAGSTGKPAALLPWLLTVSRALLAARAAVDHTAYSGEWQFLMLLDALLSTQPYARHREWLASDAALQQAVANALLECCLPAIAAAVSAEAAAGQPGSGQAFEMLQRLPGLLMHPSLAPVLRQRLQGPGALAVAQAAIQVVEALPLPRPAGMAPAHFGNLHGLALMLLSTLNASMEVAQVAGSTAEAAAEPATSGSAAVAELAPSRYYQQQAAWQLVALVPRLTSVIQALADDADAATAYPDDPSAWNHNLSAACASLSVVLCQISCLRQQPGTSAQLASGAAAATAGLRLQPLLLRLDASFQQCSLGAEDDGTTYNGAQLLSEVLLRHAWQGMARLQEQAGAAAADIQAGRRSLALRLWELHSAAARLCHFLVSQGSPVLAGSPALSRTDLWINMIAYLKNLYQHAHPLLSDAFGNGGLEPEALSLTHVEAVLALVGALGAADFGAAASHQLRDVVNALFNAAWTAHSADPAMWRSLEEALEAAVAPLVQSHGLSVEHARLLTNIAEAAAQRPRLAATLARGSLLSLLLQAAEELGDTCGAEQQAPKLLDSWDAAVMALARAASSAIASAPEDGLPDSLAAQLRQGARSLRRRQYGALSGLAIDASAADRAAQLRQLLQPAAHLAGLLQQCFALPAVEDRSRLAVARAAATRSCAYLRCANVAGEGRPAAGQGVGSSRCSACRAVWYCGTACSHADWRAGHRRVCKQLAAERQARKQAAAAAAAAGRQQQQ